MGTHLHSEKLILLDFSIPLAVKLTAKLDWLGEVLAAQEINIHRNCKTQHWTDQELSSPIYLSLLLVVCIHDAYIHDAYIHDVYIHYAFNHGAFTVHVSMIRVSMIHLSRAHVFKMHVSGCIHDAYIYDPGS